MYGGNHDVHNQGKQNTNMAGTVFARDGWILDMVRARCLELAHLFYRHMACPRSQGIISVNFSQQFSLPIKQSCRLWYFLHVMWFRSIYLSSMFAVLVWMLPYAVGTMFYHYRTGRWKRAALWTVMVLAIPSLTLSWVFAHALNNVLFTPYTTVLIASCVFMLGQTIFWRVTWKSHSHEEMGKWRLKGKYAYAMSLILTVLAFGSLAKERGLNYYDDMRIHREEKVNSERLAAAGYETYPGAEFPYGSIFNESNEILERNGEYGGSLNLEFTTGDEPEIVFDFFTQRAVNSNLKALAAVSRMSGDPALIVYGNNGAALELVDLPGNSWSVTIYYGIPSNFPELLETLYVTEADNERAASQDD